MTVPAPPRLLFGFLIAAVFAASAVASAQESGGSFAGDDFSSSFDDDLGPSLDDSSSSSSGGGESSWWDNSSYGVGDPWNDTSEASGGACAGRAGTLFFAVGLPAVLIVILVSAALRRARRGRGSAGRRPWKRGRSSDGDRRRDLHFSVLQIGLDWHVRAGVQTQLARLAREGDPASREGRARLLGETTLALRRAETGWLYAAYRQESRLGREDAERLYRAAGQEARARFRREVVRNAGGDIVEQSAEMPAPRADEGPGTAVVTLIVVARRDVAPVSDVRNARDIREALGDRGTLTPDEIVALEVVWSPALETDRMSSAELEQFYPELAKIDPASIAGRVWCEYCGGPFAMELLRCPHCGASVRSSK